ncbi:hypothetical protein KC669_02735 [Candidatus Dojkabacteria bacterium]|uniref:Fibronectin type-III domain-containing protein n=1 Tax=Candidatus Dojkabacteria bacterium TaxID=2099670 RepID=A0A955LB04_9BACT|nr:hypothetical protein [Candidatus Dojkabacteria bacterium]
MEYDSRSKSQLRRILVIWIIIALLASSLGAFQLYNNENQTSDVDVADTRVAVNVTPTNVKIVADCTADNKPFFRVTWDHNVSNVNGYFVDVDVNDANVWKAGLGNIFWNQKLPYGTSSTQIPTTSDPYFYKYVGGDPSAAENKAEKLTSIQEGIAYKVRVLAINNQGGNPIGDTVGTGLTHGGCTKVTTDSTPTSVTVTAPTNLKATPKCSGLIAYIELTWTAGKNATGYFVDVDLNDANVFKTGSGNYFWNSKYSSTVTTANIPGSRSQIYYAYYGGDPSSAENQKDILSTLQLNTAYKVQVSAIQPSGQGNPVPSSQLAVTTLDCKAIVDEVVTNTTDTNTTGDSNTNTDTTNNTDDAENTDNSSQTGDIVISSFDDAITKLTDGTIDTTQFTNFVDDLLVNKCKGDFDTSGLIDLKDFSKFASSFNKPFTGDDILLDLTTDGAEDFRLNLNDFAIFAKNFKKDINTCVYPWTAAEALSFAQAVANKI